MYSVKNSGDSGSEKTGAADEPFFIEDYDSSEGEESVMIPGNRCQQLARLSRGSSPPLLLAYSVSSGPSLQDSSLSSPSQEEEEEEDQPIEEWMILGGEEQVGDSSIQLNLGYWTSSEEDAGDEGI